VKRVGEVVEGVDQVLGEILQGAEGVEGRGCGAREGRLQREEEREEGVDGVGVDVGLVVGRDEGVGEVMEETGLVG